MTADDLPAELTARRLAVAGWPVQASSPGAEEYIC
jgi:hypothetical protein